MKKVKVVASTLALAVAMMGAGYAYWSETLTINNTVNTGELSAAFANPEVKDRSAYLGPLTGASVNGADNNVLDVVFDDVYPGAKATLKFDIQETGTVGAKIDNFDFKAYDAEYAEHVILKTVKVGASTYTVNRNVSNLGDILPVEFEKNLPLTGVEMTFEIDPAATETQFGENGTMSFTMVADVLQENDPE